MPIDLLTSPHSQPGALGLPMPDDPHAVSACLPLWDHNIGYEEARPEVVERLKAAYPRFCFHPLVNKLCDLYLNSEGRKGLPFASALAARRAADYVRHAAHFEAELVPFSGQPATGVIVDESYFGVLKQYWQHAGENVSSRAAELILNDAPAISSETAARSTVRNRVAQTHQTSIENVFLFPSGMSAIAAAWRTTRTLRSGVSCQFGFPYVDTLKIQQRFPGARHTFFPVGNAIDLKTLEEQCQASPPDVIFCEVPTNPLLVTPDLQRLRELADQHDILLVVDDTLAACGNLTTLPYADLLATSLTKYFSGYGNVLAGSLTVNPDGRHAADLLRVMNADFEELLCDADAEVLCVNSEDVHARVEMMNRNAARLATFLRQHSLVDSVYYPSINDLHYETLRTQSGGYGALLSVVLKDAKRTTPVFFDSLNVCKGPNLGTNFTLCCPYTILAHYGELSFAEECGVSRWLLRISVGVEPTDELIARFDQALLSGG